VLDGAASSATAINASSQIVGIFAVSSSASHAFLYSANGDQTVHDLGALASGDYSQAQAINSAGQVVGCSNLAVNGLSDHAFVYTSSGGMTDLNSLIPPGSGWDLEQATGINDSGWIVGYGSNSAGATHAFLLRHPADANGDGMVDINDLTTVLNNYGKTGMAWSQGNLTGDATVDINDLTQVLTYYGATYGAGIESVPEPATLTLFLSAAALLAFACRKRLSRNTMK